MIDVRQDRFADRHIGPSADDVERMLEAVGASSLETLIDEDAQGSEKADDE